MVDKDPQAEIVTAALLIIGNEILSGRTTDANLPFLAHELNEIGVQLREVRVVADDEGEIIEALNALRQRWTYVFTTGGIGPTHDDITSASVAKALGLPLVRHPEAARLLETHYPPERRTAARMKMADTPEGAELIENPVSIAPGYRIANVFVLAGVPKIMQAMWEFVRPQLRGGARMLSRTLTVYAGEGDVAEGLTALQERFKDIEIGSYPFFRFDRPGTNIVLRGIEKRSLDAAFEALQAQCAGAGISTEEASSA